MSEPEHVRSAETVEMIRVVMLRGEGEHPSPFREVYAYYSPDGTFIGEHDMWAEDAEAAAEDARELTQVANRTETRTQDAQQVRAAMADWDNREEHAAASGSPCKWKGHEWGTMWQGDEPWMRCLRCAAAPEDASS